MRKLLLLLSKYLPPSQSRRLLEYIPCRHIQSVIKLIDVIQRTSTEVYKLRAPSCRQVHEAQQEGIQIVLDKLGNASHLCVKRTELIWNIESSERRSRARAHSSNIVREPFTA